MSLTTGSLGERLGLGVRLARGITPKAVLPLSFNPSFHSRSFGDIAVALICRTTSCLATEDSSVVSLSLPLDRFVAYYAKLTRPTVTPQHFMSLRKPFSGRAWCSGGANERALNISRDWPIQGLHPPHRPGAN